MFIFLAPHAFGVHYLRIRKTSTRDAFLISSSTGDSVKGVFQLRRRCPSHIILCLRCRHALIFRWTNRQFITNKLFSFSQLVLLQLRRRQPRYDVAFLTFANPASAGNRNFVCPGERGCVHTVTASSWSVCRLAYVRRSCILTRQTCHLLIIVRNTQGETCSANSVETCS